jgi:hypothetical protein
MNTKKDMKKDMKKDKDCDKYSAGGMAKYAAGGVGKIRHEQSTSEGNPKKMRREKVKGCT